MVFIYVGFGGVGIYVIQLAKYLGVRVVIIIGFSNVEWVCDFGVICGLIVIRCV